MCWTLVYQLLVTLFPWNNIQCSIWHQDSLLHKQMGTGDHSLSAFYISNHMAIDYMELRIQGCRKNVHTASHNLRRMRRTKLEKETVRQQTCLNLPKSSRWSLTTLLHFPWHLECKHVTLHFLLHGEHFSEPWHFLPHLCPQNRVLSHFSLHEWLPSLQRWQLSWIEKNIYEFWPYIMFVHTTYTPMLDSQALAWMSTIKHFATSCWAKWIVWFGIATCRLAVMTTGIKGKGDQLFASSG